MIPFTVCFGPYWDHVSGYWKQKDNPNLLLLTYEEMKKVKLNFFFLSY